MLDALQHSQAAVPTGTIDHAIALVADDLAATELEISRLLESPIPIIPLLGEHIVFAGGKRFRPLATLLAAQAIGFEDRARIVLAAAGELLHTATLLHDDVVDGGEFRRGRQTARLRFGNGLSVLTGDFCLARSLQAVASLGAAVAVRTLADAVTRMAEGEISQLEMAGNWTMNRERYLAVIDRKTAALIAWCTGLAGMAPDPAGAALTQYGREIGHAFQIVDDIIDYQSDVGHSGKRRGQDLREGKATLPLLIACGIDPTLRDELDRVLGTGRPTSDADIDPLLDRVCKSGALDQSRALAFEHARAATLALDGVPDSPARRALETLALHVASRST